MQEFRTRTPTIACLIMLAACSGSPDMESTATASAAVADPDDPNLVTCKNVVRTGSRFTKKVCRTNAEWRQAATDGREALESVQRSSTHH